MNRINLGERDYREFLSNYWDKDFLFLKNGLPLELSFTVDDYKSMAESEQHETRLVENCGDKYNLSFGPFERGQIELANPWTLLIHNMNLYERTLFHLQQRFDFIPGWLFDDMMMTFSSKGSSVGAHIDNYNVFIVQVSGSRKWSLEKDPNPEYQET